MTRFGVLLLVGIPAFIALVVATVFRFRDVMVIYYVYCVAQILVCGGWFIYCIGKGEFSDDVPEQRDGRTSRKHGPDEQRRFPSRVLQRINATGKEFRLLYYGDKPEGSRGEGRQASG